MQITVTTTN